MKRSGGLRRLTGLRRVTIRAASGASRPRRPANYTGPSREVVALVGDRDLWTCVVQCHPCCDARPHYGLAAHHRRNRGAGGSSLGEINSPENLLIACSWCNGWLEDNPAASYINGWKVKHGAHRPGIVPVLYPDGRWWLLDVLGARRETTWSV